MELLQTETVAEGHTVDVTVKRFRRADGKEVERQVVEHPGSVAILAHDAEYAYLVRQPREAVEEDELLEIPAGTLDVERESALECAQRELSEEIGLRAQHWRQLRTIYTSPGFLDERCTIFEATGLSPAPAVGDDEEEIEIVRLPLGELEAALTEIRDAKTVVALQLLSARQSS